MDAYLKDVQRPVRMYWGIWTAALAGLMVGQGIYAPFTDGAERASLIVGGSISAAGLIVLLAMPTPGRKASDRYRALPAGSIDEQRAKLAAGEKWLEAEAKNAARARSWIAHVAAAGVSVGVFLGLGLGIEDNWLRATVSGVGALAIIETRILTRPKRGIQHFARYRADPDAPAQLVQSGTPERVFVLAPALSGRDLGLRATFTF